MQQISTKEARTGTIVNIAMGIVQETNKFVIDTVLIKRSVTSLNATISMR